MSAVPPDIAAHAEAVQRWLNSQAPLKSEAEYNAMSQAEHWAYMRSFNQAAMAPWKDPRT